jgi:DNA-binding NarL/FixJ family response regulator
MPGTTSGDSEAVSGSATRVVVIDAEPSPPGALARLEAAAGGPIDVVGALSSTVDAERMVRELRPSVVLIDVLLPLGQQRDLIKRMNDELPSTSFLSLTPSDIPDDRVLYALRAGALGFVERDATAEDLAEAIGAASMGEPWLPNRAGSSVLRRAAHRLELTPGERTNRMGQLVLAVIPIAAVLGAALGYMIRTYWGEIGVRTEDLGAGTDDRLIDIAFLMLLVAGAFGPLVFVPSWTRAVHGRLLGGAPSSRTSTLAVGASLAAAVLGVAIALLVLTPAFLALIVGPLVTAVVAANAIGLADQLPGTLALDWKEARRAALVAAALAGALLVMLGAELSRGPDLRRDGLHGFLAPDIMGDDVSPVRFTGTDGEFELEAILLGAAGSRFVAYDPCTKVVVHVPAGIVTAEVIDEVTC